MFFVCFLNRKYIYQWWLLKFKFHSNSFVIFWVHRRVTAFETRIYQPMISCSGLWEVVASSELDEQRATAHHPWKFKHAQLENAVSRIVTFREISPCPWVPHQICSDDHPCRNGGPSFPINHNESSYSWFLHASKSVLICKFITSPTIHPTTNQQAPTAEKPKA